MSRMKAVLAGATLIALAPLGACTQPASATDLNPAGPPMIRQVLMSEEFTNAQGTIQSRFPVLAFGHHDDPSFAMDDGKVVAAVTKPTAVQNGQSIRVVVDELLVGNYLEEIECRSIVDPDAKPIAASYSRVPLGSTPDDVAKCSGPQDLVTARCTGERAVCINRTSSPQITKDGATIMPGQPAGILDTDPPPDGDGVPDADLFIEGAVRVMCKTPAGKTVEAPLDLAATYWQPSGNQQVPAHGGVALLGPALVLNFTIGLPTSSTCTLQFDPDVVDKDGNAVCAPPNGDVDQDCPAPGDTSLVTFGTAALRQDANGNQQGGLNSNATVQFTTTMDINSLQNNITLTEDGVPFPFTVMPTGGSALLQYTLFTSTAGGTRENPGHTYVLTILPTVTDFAGTPLGGQPIVTTWQT